MGEPPDRVADAHSLAKPAADAFLNVVATGAYFFLMSWFMLRTQP